MKDDADLLAKLPATSTSSSVKGPASPSRAKSMTFKLACYHNTLDDNEAIEKLSFSGEILVQRCGESHESLSRHGP